MGITTGTLEIEEIALKNIRREIADRIKANYNPWLEYFNSFKTSDNPDIIKIVRFLEFGEIGCDFDSKNFQIQPSYNEELRESNSKIMNVISSKTKFFLGGSADLSSSCKTNLYKEAELTRQYQLGRNIYFGVREHAMGSILNGMALNNLQVYGSTFLCLADYLKPAIRMSAMMNLPVTYIFTHDTIGIGQDGATHQPIEQLTMLRTTPNLEVLRPADINEVIGSWDYILKKRKPTALIISKDMQHILAGTNAQLVEKGGYVVNKEKERLDAIIIATGTDLTTACLIKEDFKNTLPYDIRIVSMPSIEVFRKETIEYQKEILPDGVKTIVIEAGDKTPWLRFTKEGYIIGLEGYGHSGKPEDVLTKMNFSYDQIKERVENILK